ncbi:MAG: alpha/beta hydrolase family protein [Solirubrobacteraceae bacterium]
MKGMRAARIAAAASAAAATAAATLAGLAAPAAAATITDVFNGQTISGNPIACTAQTDGVRVCHGADGGGGASDLRLKTFDGVALEVYVILPPAPGSGTDGNYPLIVQSHGWGGSAGGPNQNAYLGPTADGWAKAGYAVLQLTARGFNDSCGSSASRLAAPTACAHGYIRLDDDRYEVRDIQYDAGLLVDAGVVDPSRIGATGPSYGGGVSLQLATLKDRMMAADGSLSPWKSPGGTPISLAAAAPVIPWSDLVYSLTPNGRTRDDAVTSPTADRSPIGVSKASFVGGLYLLGSLSGYYAPPLTDPQADLTTWNTLINAGEPYDSNPQDQALEQQIATYHSAYYLLDGAFGVPHEAPPPLLIANGFTDDLFPVDEAVRYYNLERSLFPGDPIALFDWDGGHMRGQNKAADSALLASRVKSFFDHYVKGSGAQTQLGATALTETCPTTAPSGGPFEAASWSALHPGQIQFTTGAAKTISSSAGDATIGKTIDPIAGGGACATVSSTDQGSGVATYRLPAATGSGYTLLGAPTVSAELTATGTFPIIAERLWDVDTRAGTQTLVARGVYRLDPNHPNGPQTFQLHPGAWHFAAGHIPKLELLGQDPPYARPSNGAFTISVGALQLLLPVHEQPGSQSIITKPTKPGVPGRCTARPRSKISAASGSRRGFSLRGTAGESPCITDSAAAQRREHVTRVYVTIYRAASRHRCRFLKSHGRLSAARSCKKPARFAARGSTHWKLKLKFAVAPGRYRVLVDAVDGLHHHQAHASAKLVKVRRNS